MTPFDILVLLVNLVTITAGVVGYRNTIKHEAWLYDSVSVMGEAWVAENLRHMRIWRLIFTVCTGAGVGLMARVVFIAFR